MNIPLKLALPAFLFLSLFQSPTLHKGASAEGPGGFCAQAELHRQKLQADETYRQASRRMEAQLYAAVQQPSSQRAPVRHTLPVVFHIIHDNGSENISDAQIDEALQHLNDAFANVGYYNPAAGVDTEIAFCLARRDPQGAATTGINRLQSALTELNYNIEDQALKNLSRWGPREYINIWVVREICNNNGCGVAGYAYLPGAHGQPYDGIVLEARYTGSSPSRSTVLVHEMGHYLGLYHTFEGGCPNAGCLVEGDRICDTPPDNTTANTPCDADMNSCSTDEDDLSAGNPFRPATLGGLGDQPDQKENYMDYSRLECYDRFCQGQKDRMLAAVENIRASLLSSPACIDPCPNPQTAAFSAGATSVPVGTTVAFTNNSTNADSYEWRIDGTVFSTAANVSYDFNTIGTYQVALTAFSALSNCLPQDSTITIEVFCPVEAGFSASATSVLAGATITFANTSANATSYTWRVDGTAASTEPDFELNTTQPGQFTVCLTAGNGLCESVRCMEIVATLPSDGGCGPSYYFTIGQPGEKVRGRVLEPAAEGGYYLGGSLNGQSLIMKFNEAGEMQWQYLLPFSNNEEIWDLEEDEEGFLFGSARQEGNANGSYCFRFSPQSQSLLWANAFSSFPEYRFYKLLSRAEIPYYIILGESEANPLVQGPGCDATFITIDKANGQLLNQRNIGLGLCDYFHNAVVAEGAIYAAGTFAGSGSGDGAIRPAIAKLSPGGELQWQWPRLYLAPVPDFAARLYGQDILLDGGELVVAGQGDFGGTSTSDVLCTLFKTDLDGNILWARQMDIPGATEERVHRLLQLEDGYLIIGNYLRSGANNNSDVFFIKTDPDGNFRWAKAMPNTGNETVFDQGAFVRDGLVYLAGSLINEEGIQAFVLRLTPDGELAGGCQALLPIDLEFAGMQNPYDGASNALAYDFNRSDSLVLLSPRPTQLATANFCGAPCEDCANGLDDDGDGSVDCDDGDCPCFEDCGNTFAKSIGNAAVNDGATTIVDAGDGNFYVGGYLDEEGMIAKISSEGVLLWVRTFDFTDRPDHIVSLFLDSDGFLVGTSFGDNGTGAFGRGATAFRYDPENGQMLWVNYFNSRGILDQIATNPATGNFFVSGVSILTLGEDNASLAELGRNTGDVLWRREFQRGSSDRFFSLLPVGNVLYCLGRSTFDSGFQKMRVALSAFTGAGNLEWSKFYLSPPSADARLYGLSVKMDGGALLSSFYGDPNGIDIFGSSISGLMKTDLAGNLLWAKWYQLAGYDALLSAYQTVVVPDGYLLYGYAVSGSRDLVIIKTGKEGNALWARAYGGLADDDIFAPGTAPILQAGDNIYFVGRSRHANGSQDALIVKAMADGSFGSNADCDFVREVPVATYDWQNPYEADAGLQEQPNPDINPQLLSMQAMAANPDCNIICASSPVDITVALDSAYCAGDSLAVALRICNEGRDTLPAGLPFTFYDGNPTATTAASLLAGGLSTSAAILPGGCFSTTVAVPYPQGQLYCIANDDGSLPPAFNLETSFPATDIIECSYSNNLDSIGYGQPVPLIGLGPDTSACENGVFRLDAGPGFAAYRWQDGSGGQTYTAFEAGTYFVEATTPCGDVVSDTIVIRLDTAILMGLRPDTSICRGAAISLSTPENPTYTYQWSPAASLSCSDCPAAIASPDTTTTYTLVVSNAAGCFSVDSITISVENCGATLDTALCLGDSLLIEGEVFYPNEMDTLQLPGGGSLFVNIAALDTFSLALNLDVCAGETVEYEGVILPSGSVVPFTFAAANGCDSTLVVSVTGLEDIQTSEPLFACQGEVGYAFGQPVAETGIYSEAYTSYQGCDSTHSIYFVVQDTAVLSIQPGSLGCTANSGSLTVEISGGAPPYRILWSDGQATATATGLSAGFYSVTVTSAFGCQSVGFEQVHGTMSRPAASPGSLPVGCFGGKDGGIVLNNPAGGTPPYEYSLGGENWQQENSFAGLPAGFYVAFIRDKDQCQTSYPVTVSEPPPTGIRLPADTTLRWGDSLAIIPLALSGQPAYYEWSPPYGLDCTDCPAPIARPEQSTRYRLTVQDSSGCSGWDEMMVYVTDSISVYLPNAFSPNGDGRNDSFTVFAGPEVEQVRTLRVFSRWGELLFQRDNFPPNREDLGWDGAFRGHLLPNGVYACYVEALLKSGRTEVVKGEVILVR